MVRIADKFLADDFCHLIFQVGLPNLVIDCWVYV